MLRRLILTTSLLAASAHAAERTLTGEEIMTLLPTITAYGKGTIQTFDTSGSTDYRDKGGDSVGYWQARSDQYCSNWPPSSTWTCYDVLLDEDAAQIIWIGDSGKPTVNTFETRPQN